MQIHAPKLPNLLWNWYIVLRWNGRHNKGWQRKTWPDGAPSEKKSPALWLSSCQSWPLCLFMASWGEQRINGDASLPHGQHRSREEEATAATSTQATSHNCKSASWKFLKIWNFWKSKNLKVWNILKVWKKFWKSEKFWKPEIFWKFGRLWNSDNL